MDPFKLVGEIPSWLGTSLASLLAFLGGSIIGAFRERNRPLQADKDNFEKSLKAFEEIQACLREVIWVSIEQERASNIFDNIERLQTTVNFVDEKFGNLFKQTLKAAEDLQEAIMVKTYPKSKSFRTLEGAKYNTVNPETGNQEADERTSEASRKLLNELANEFIARVANYRKAGLTQFGKRI